MRKLKIFGLVSASILTVFYIVYLLVLPIVVDLSFAKDFVKTLAKEQIGVDINFDRMKLITGFPLKAGVKIINLNLTCDNSVEVAKLENASVKISLIPLIFKKIQISNVDINSLIINLDISKEGKLSLEKCFVISEQPETSSSKNDFNFAIDEKLPVVKLKNIILNLKDAETLATLSLKLDELFLDKAVLNKHFFVDTQGKILLNEINNINFDLRIDSFMPVITSFESSEVSEPAEYFNFIKEFVNYNLLADIKADLKIKQKNKDIYMNGYANIDGLSFKIDGRQLPVSYLHTKFTDKQGEMDSRIYVSETENFALNSTIRRAKNIDLDASFTTDKLSFFNIQKIVLAIMNSLNIRNDFGKLKTNGYIVSNLKLKTDSEKFESEGNFRIADGEIISQTDGLFIKNINSSINLENNALQINKTSALVNDSLFDIKGTINSDAMVDITINTNKLPLSKLASAFLAGDMKKNYDIKSGTLDLNLLLNGKLDKLKPSLNVVLLSLEIFDKINKITLTNSDTNIKIVTDGKEFNGNIISNNTKAALAGMNVNLSIPSLKADILTDKITINKSDILLNSSKTVLQGTVENYLNKPALDIKLDGNIAANDIKNLLPKEISSLVSAKGQIPLKVKIDGTENIDIKAQIFANANNNIDLITVDKLKNQNSILNTDIEIGHNNILIKDIGFYLPKVKSLSDDFSSNISSAQKVVGLTGELLEGARLKNIKIETSEPLKLNIMNISMNAKGNIVVEGKIAAPLLKGNINLTNINAPDYLIKGQLANINITTSLINADLLGLDLNGSIVDLKAEANSNFSFPFVINTLDITSDLIDLDKILLITTKFPQNTASQKVSNASNSSVMVPVNINKGSARLGNFKIGTLAVENVSSNFMLFNDTLELKNIKALAYKGNLAGTIEYNLKNLKMKAKLSGENMDANPAVGALLGIKNQIMGNLKFDADISMQGATMEEQLKSLKGNANFEVKDGQLGSLGKLETYLKAANIISSKFVQSSINTIISAVMPYNSGQISYAKGQLKFSDGNVKFEPINSSGKEMALNITGYLNMINYNGDIKILGRLNQEIVNLLGPLGNISVDKIIGYIPKIGDTAANLFKTFNIQATEKDLANIPSLTPNANSKTFKVLIKGNTMSANAVKSFQWLSAEEAINSAETSIEKQFAISTSKDELLEQVKTNVQTQTQQKINEAVDNNETLKTIKTFGDILKNKIPTNTQQ